LSIAKDTPADALSIPGLSSYLCDRLSTVVIISFSSVSYKVRLMNTYLFKTKTFRENCDLWKIFSEWSSMKTDQNIRKTRLGDKQNQVGVPITSETFDILPVFS